MESKLICEEGFINSGLDRDSLTRILSIAKKASKIGGDILLSNYRNITQIENKGRIGDLVTNSDLQAESAIIKYLEKATPNFSILAEESGYKENLGDISWCIDPLDGTTNYAHGYPFFATSIGLTYKSNPILGAIAVPFLNQTYYAAPYIGSFCNDKKIQVSTTKSLVNSLLVTGFAYDRQTTKENNYSEFIYLTHKTRGVRRGGAAAVDLAFTAAGMIDGYWERGLSKWDIAAGVPIVELAGGIIKNYPSGDFNFSSGRILACNPHIEKELRKELNSVKPLDIKDIQV